MKPPRLQRPCNGLATDLQRDWTDWRRCLIGPHPRFATSTQSKTGYVKGFFSRPKTTRITRTQTTHAITCPHFAWQWAKVVALNMANRTGQPSLMGCSLSSRRDSPRLGVVDVLLTTCRGTPQFMARCLDSVWICGVQLAKNGKIWQVKTCFWTLWMDLGVLHFESVSKNASGCLVHVPCIFQKIPGWKVSAG